MPIIEADAKAALKASDKLKLSVLRLLKAAIKNRQIEKGRELSDEEIFAVITTLVKQRRESIEQFSRGGRTELAEQEQLEMAVLQAYLPQQLSPEDIDSLIREAIQESGAAGEADMGRVMRILMPRIKGVADGKIVNNRVRELLRPS
ncbi:MAG: GatB/YqeY domain-containing protein [Nitrospiraceae bacterium]|nr:GatB/YqeY domain-containing protein [Nitrospiraceae bacterium]